MTSLFLLEVNVIIFFDEERIKEWPDQANRMSLYK